MAYYIETYCGPKWGGYLRGTVPYPSAEAAQDAADWMTACEAQAKATRMMRRVVATPTKDTPQ